MNAPKDQLGEQLQDRRDTIEEVLKRDGCDDEDAIMDAIAAHLDTDAATPRTENVENANLDAGVTRLDLDVPGAF